MCTCVCVCVKVCLHAIPSIIKGGSWQNAFPPDLCRQVGVNSFSKQAIRVLPFDIPPQKAAINLA